MLGASAPLQATELLTADNANLPRPGEDTGTEMWASREDDMVNWGFYRCVKGGKGSWCHNVLTEGEEVGEDGADGGDDGKDRVKEGGVGLVAGEWGVCTRKGCVLGVGGGRGHLWRWKGE